MESFVRPEQLPDDLFVSISFFLLFFFVNGKESQVPFNKHLAYCLKGHIDI